VLTETILENAMKTESERPEFDRWIEEWHAIIQKASPVVTRVSDERESTADKRSDAEKMDLHRARH
jgi:hypothetical protein